MLYFLSVCALLLAQVTRAQTSPSATVSPATGCLARYVRVENTPGVTNQNFYVSLMLFSTGARVRDFILPR